MSFEELMKLKEQIGAKVYSETVFGQHRVRFTEKDTNMYIVKQKYIFLFYIPGTQTRRQSGIQARQQKPTP